MVCFSHNSATIANTKNNKNKIATIILFTVAIIMILIIVSYLPIFETLCTGKSKESVCDVCFTMPAGIYQCKMNFWQLLSRFIISKWSN